MTITAVAAPIVPQPLAYQRRARLLCAPCFDGADPRPRLDGDAVIPIPAQRPTSIVAKRPCATCGGKLPMPGLFGLGLVAATPGALATCQAGRVDPARLLARHWTGDWGEIDAGDLGLNEDAIRDGARIFSVYHLANRARVWVITEAGRQGTTLLLPSEY